MIIVNNEIFLAKENYRLVSGYNRLYFFLCWKSFMFLGCHFLTPNDRQVRPWGSPPYVIV